MSDYQVKCSDCKQKYQLGVANSVLHLYRQRLYACWVESICPCGDDARNFLEPDEAKVLLGEKIPSIVEDDCEPWVLEEWQRVNDIELAQPVELTPRHEELIESLRVILDKTPDRHLMDIFSSPPPKSQLPRMWHD